MINERLRSQYNLNDYLDTLDPTEDSDAKEIDLPQGQYFCWPAFFSVFGEPRPRLAILQMQSLLYQILYQRPWLYGFFRDKY
jgi:hypothetical protein